MQHDGENQDETTETEFPKISLLMPNFNGEKYLNLAIRSFLFQKYPNKELVIIDGKSTDGSHAIINRFAAQYSSIQWVKELDCGLSDALNIGIQKSSGDIIGFLGSDDILYPGILEEIGKVAPVIEFDAIYFNSFNYYPQAKKCVLYRCPDLELNRRNLVSHGVIVGGQDIFYKRHIFEKHRYNPDNRYCMDFELQLDIAENEHLFVYVERPATWNIIDQNISSRYASEQMKEVFSVSLKHAKTPSELARICWRYRKSPGFIAVIRGMIGYMLGEGKRRVIESSQKE
jgi:glycosyltransferase involved in cell wall biosynthesis